MSVGRTLLASAAMLVMVGVPGPHVRATTEPACAEVDGIEPLLDPGRVVLVGELHGSEESPKFVAALACHALTAGLAVTVALEWPVQEAERVNAFVDSAGSDADRDELLGGWLGASDEQDGRRSEAMVALLDTVRTMRGAGLDVDVALLDDATGTGERDQWMAENLAAAAEANPDGVVVSLTGNVHSMVAPLPDMNPDYEPMGVVALRLLDADRVVAIDVTFDGGTVWACMASCGVQDFGPPGPAADAVTVVLHPADTSSGHHGEYDVGSLTASPPAIESAGS